MEAIGAAMKRYIVLLNKVVNGTTNIPAFVYPKRYYSRNTTSTSTGI